MRSCQISTISCTCWIEKHILSNPRPPSRLPFSVSRRMFPPRRLNPRRVQTVEWSLAMKKNTTTTNHQHQHHRWTGTGLPLNKRNKPQSLPDKREWELMSRQLRLSCKRWTHTSGGSCFLFLFFFSCARRILLPLQVDAGLWLEIVKHYEKKKVMLNLHYLSISGSARGEKIQAKSCVL